MKSNSVFSMNAGDMYLQSKHADVAFKSPDGFAYFWFNTPKKGKCLSVEYDTSNYPRHCNIH